MIATIVSCLALTFSALCGLAALACCISDVVRRWRLTPAERHREDTSRALQGLTCDLRCSVRTASGHLKCAECAPRVSARFTTNFPAHRRGARGRNPPVGPP